MKSLIAAAVVGLSLSLSAAVTPASAAEVMVCAVNESGLVGEANFTFYVGDGETRWDSGWQRILLGANICYHQNDVRAMNVTIRGMTTKWVKVCDVNRRPGESLKVTMKGTLFSQSCEVW
ncbi:hypothetical protein ACM64Y_04350 [Novispirillum sp. DQ9]|uniref:hypothetical protein n=1 Tax=Novispirillum sp. DQ9 TaxID=3398612 RepID=UPI003C7DA5D9